MSQGIASKTVLDPINLLKQGNSRYIKNQSLNLNSIQDIDAKQEPFAAIVSCIDPRVIPESIFDLPIGSLFVARVAGNIINDDIMGSLEYAAEIRKIKTIVVMGHSDCGAVKAACDRVQLGLLSSLLSRILPAVHKQNKYFPYSNSQNDDFVQSVAKENIVMGIQSLLDKSIIIKKRVTDQQLEIIGAMYNVHTGQVEFLENSYF